MRLVRDHRLLLRFTVIQTTGNTNVLLLQPTTVILRTSTRYPRVIISSSSPTYSYPFSWASPSLLQNTIKYRCGLDSVVKRVYAP